MALSPPEQRVVDFLAGAGRATKGSIGRALYGNPRNPWTGPLLDRLVAKGVVEHYLIGHGLGRGYRLRTTDSQNGPSSHRL